MQSLPLNLVPLVPQGLKERSRTTCRTGHPSARIFCGQLEPIDVSKERNPAAMIDEHGESTGC